MKFRLTSFLGIAGSLLYIGCNNQLSPLAPEYTEQSSATINSGGGWRQYSCSDGVGDIGAGPTGVLYRVGGINGTYGAPVYKLKSGSWVRISGLVTRIDVDGNGKPWAVNKEGKVFKGDGNGGWTEMTGVLAGEIGVGQSGQVYVVGPEISNYGGPVYKLTGSGWQKISGLVTRIDVDGSGKPWAINKEGKIYKGDGYGGWTELSRIAGYANLSSAGGSTALKPVYIYGSDISVTQNGEPYVVATDGWVYKWTGAFWLKINGKATRISVYSNSRVFIADQDNMVSEFKMQIDKTIGVISIGGTGSTDIHPVVSACAEKAGFFLAEGLNWQKDNGNWVSDMDDANRIKNRINNFANLLGGNKTNLRLLIVGKSAGGVLSWNTYRWHSSTINEFNKMCMVLVDPHGTVSGDDQFGTYCDRQNLWWPSGWKADKSTFRIFDIYQHKKSLTGASFPDTRVYLNHKITESGISHDNIATNWKTAETIRNAFYFLTDYIN